MIDTLHIDDLDGAVTLFKSTDEGTETIAVFDEEHREVIEYLAKQVNRFREGMKDMLYRLEMEERDAGHAEQELEQWIDTWKHWLKEMIE